MNFCTIENLPLCTKKPPGAADLLPVTHPRWFFIYLFFWFGIHTVGAPITSRTHKDGGAIIRKLGSTWLEGTPAMDH